MGLLPLRHSQKKTEFAFLGGLSLDVALPKELWPMLLFRSFSIILSREADCDQDCDAS